MKKTIKLAVVAALALGATSAFATNGDHLIGLGAKARGMGGIGIGMSHGAESALANPALITSVANTEISFGGTVFMPNVEYNGGAGYESSAADMNVIPEVSIASKVSDDVYVGIGIWGTAGMGTDYRDASAATMKMVTNLQLMQFGVPVAYKTNGLSLGVTPILQYGALDINYNFGGQVGAGVAQDLAFGYTLGAAYEMDGLTIGASYKSAIEMDYRGQLTSAMAPFEGAGVIPAGAISDKLEQPAEIGVGASYTMGEHTIAVDYKNIRWAAAEGYKQFGWENQNVIIVGYQFTQDNWALRAGYNYGKNPIKEQNGAAVPGTGAALNMFNLVGFPAIVESHYTIGGTYNVSKTVSIDGAFTYAAETTETYDVTAISGMLGGTTSVSTKHSQTGVSAQVNFAF